MAAASGFNAAAFAWPSGNLGTYLPNPKPQILNPILWVSEGGYYGNLGTDHHSAWGWAAATSSMAIMPVTRMSMATATEKNDGGRCGDFDSHSHSDVTRATAAPATATATTCLSCFVPLSQRQLQAQ